MISLIRASSVLAVALGTWLALPSSARALSIAFQVVDLPDPISGMDRQRYVYTLDEFPFPAGSGFSILYDVSLYSDLELAGAPSSADFDIALFQPDPAIPDEGLFDAVALRAAPAGLGPFAVDFTFSNPSLRPGSQTFVVFDPQFTVVTTGQTVPAGAAAPVPEPISSALFVAGALAIAPALARRRRSSR